MAVIDQPERSLIKCTSMQYDDKMVFLIALFFV